MSGRAAGSGPREVRAGHVEERRRREGRDRGYRRAVRVGLGISVLVHLLLLFLLGRGLQMPAMDYEPILPPVAEQVPGLRLVRVTAPEPTAPRTAASPDRPRPRPEAEQQPEEDPAEERPAEEQRPADPAETQEAEVSNAERLQPREGDPRLWKDFWDEDLERRYLGGTARADSAIRAILGRYLDSLRLSEEELRRARDWTIRSGEERWGISPEGIHLGEITIPLPVDQILSPTGPRRRELERELRELEEIQRQEALIDAEEIRKARIEAMEERARREAEEGSEEDSTADGDG